MSIILALAVVISNLSAFTVYASPAVNLVNVKANSESSAVAPIAADTDSNGNTYVMGHLFTTGTTSTVMATPLASADFGGTTLTQSNYSSTTVFLAKYDALGVLSWAKGIGSAKTSYNYGDQAKSIKADSSGNVFISGNFMQTLDLGQDGVFEATSAISNNQGFIMKLNAQGVKQWVIPILSTESGSSIDRLDIDDSGNLYMTGIYNKAITVYGTGGTSTIFPNGLGFDNSGTNIFVMKISNDGAIQWSVTGRKLSADAYILKISNTGVLQWFKTISNGTTSGTEYINQVVVDTSGNPIIVGLVNSTNVDLDPGVGSARVTSTGADGFVAKLDSSGNLQWYQLATGTGSEPLTRVFLDSTGNIYASGTISTGAHSIGGETLTSAGGVTDAFLWKLNSSGNSQWVKQLGGAGADSIVEAEVAPNDDVRIVARIAGTVDVNPGTDIVNATSSANAMAAMATFTWSKDGGLTTFNELVSNISPEFIGNATTFSVSQNAGATDIKGLLHVSDSDSSQTLIWSQSVAPNHGGTLNFSSATASSGNEDVMPGGTITYTPANGYIGTEDFTVQVSDGTATATKTINVTVTELAPAAPIGLGITAEDSSVVLDWTPVTGATSYKVYQGIASGSYNATAVATVATNTATINGLTNGITYYEEVKLLAIQLKYTQQIHW